MTQTILDQFPKPEDVLGTYLLPQRLNEFVGRAKQKLIRAALKELALG